jgi:hypothetical protein
MKWFQGLFSRRCAAGGVPGIKNAQGLTTPDSPQAPCSPPAERRDPRKLSDTRDQILAYIKSATEARALAVRALAVRVDGAKVIGMLRAARSIMRKSYNLDKTSLNAGVRYASMLFEAAETDEDIRITVEFISGLMFAIDQQYAATDQATQSIRLSYLSRIKDIPGASAARRAKASDSEPSALPTQSASASTQSAQVADSSPTGRTAGRPVAPGDSVQWYTAADLTRHMSQVVVNIPPGNDQESQFGTLMLSLQKYPIIMQTWCTTFFRLDDQPGPFLLVRTDNIASELRTRPISVGFSFFKFNSGGLFVIFIRVRDDSILPRLKARLPDLQIVAVEGMMGLDDQDQVKRISDALEKDELHIVVAGNSPSTMEAFDPSSGRSVQSSAPQAAFDIKVAIPNDSRRTLQEEFRSLLVHHASIPLPQRTWNTIQQDYGNAMPLSVEPILAQKATSPASPSAAPTP